jgi:hypothetical protein
MKPRLFPVLLLPLLPAAPATAAETPIAVGDRRQLLLDGHFVREAKGVDFVLHRPVKTDDRIVVSEPNVALSGYHSALFDGGVYHLWYSAGPGVLYARSRDGVHWEKPDVRTGGADGDARFLPPNLVLGGGAGGVKGGVHGLMVFIDPKAPAADRFKLVCNPHEYDGQLQLFSSADGIQWRHHTRDLVTFDPAVKPNHLDSQNVIFWDDRIGKYVAYFRKNVREPGPKGEKFPRTRMVARFESPVLGHFGRADDAPVVMQADPDHVVPPAGAREGLSLLDTYTNGAIRYPWAQDVYLMFPVEYYHYGAQIADFRKEAPVNAGATDTRFASSRDGISWNRHGHATFVGLGMRGEFDSRRIYMVHGILPAPNGRELYLYYLGTSETHGWHRDDRNNQLLTAADLAPTGPSVISRVVLRRDGFVSVRAGFRGGGFRTPPVTFAGEQLLLNVDTGAAGHVRVELQDESGAPLPGFSLADCDLVYTANEISRAVRWKGKTELGPLQGRAVRLRFELRDADLYAFQFAERGGI